MDKIRERLEGLIGSRNYEVQDTLGSYNPNIRTYRLINKKTGHTAISKYAFRKEGKEIIRAGELLKKIGKHPNIVEVYDIIDASPGDSRVLIMEDVEGEDLEMFTEGMPIEEGLALEIVSDVCYGLGAVHEKGIVHRDLAPGNIIYSPKATKLIDFGSAGIAGLKTTSPYTLGFASPEQVNGTCVDERSDVYNLGGILFWLITSTAPFYNALTKPGTNNQVKELDRMQQNPYLILEQDTENRVSDLCRELILDCMRPNPRLRPENTYDLANDIYNLIEEIETQRTVEVYGTTKIVRERKPGEEWKTTIHCKPGAAIAKEAEQYPDAEYLFF